MKFHRQLISHDPANGRYGDCYRTALACLLDKEPAEVPHFCDGGRPEGEAFEKAQAYLEGLGLRILTVVYQGVSLDDVLRCIGHYNPKAQYLLTGLGPRGVNHVVVCEGSKIIHDPSGCAPEQSIVGPAQPDGLYWIEHLTLAATAAAAERIAQLTRERDEARADEVEKNRKLRETLERIRSKTLANVSDCFLHGYVMETIDAVLREMEASKTGGAG